MKNLVWFCIGILTGHGLPKLWHTFYIVTIAILTYRILFL